MNKKKQIAPLKPGADKDMRVYTWVTAEEAIARAKKTFARVGLPKELTKGK